MYTYCVLFLCIISTTYGYNDTKRIINGWNVTEGKYPPYYALIYLNNDPHCGGTVIKNNVILTAASVVSGYQPSAFKIYPGLTRLADVPSLNPYYVNSIQTHNNYIYGNASYDIAVMILTSTIPFNNNRINKINLTDMEYPVNSIVNIVGFGLTNCSKLEYNSAERVYKCTGQASYKLNYGNLVITKYNGNVMVTQNTFATVGPCYGDFGGPVVYDNRLVGVQSLIQKPNCTGESYQVSVAKLKTWIDSKIN